MLRLTGCMTPNVQVERCAAPTLAENEAVYRRIRSNAMLGVPGAQPQTNNGTSNENERELHQQRQRRNNRNVTIV